MQKSYKLGGLGGHNFAALKTGVYDGKIAGLYDLEETLGRGHFAVVKLARHVFTGEKVAVKVIDKSKLDSVSKAHLFQEVRCMKLVQHPNVVRLYEVIDTATKLYLILELGDGGDLYDYIMRHESGLCEQLARDYFAQIVRAITYCHQLHVVHRDLKPENVVFFEKLGVVKLTDFGFSNKFSPGQKLETSCGSLAYSAPEILLGDSYDAPAVDVWSLGVILYMLVCGHAPFHEANDSETLTMIMDCKYTVPIHISNNCKALIARMLVRAPEKRATLAEIAAHSWFSCNRSETIDVLPLVAKEHLSEEDHTIIVQKMVNGNIAAKEEIQACLDKNDYNHITATYFLLAERKLRFKRQEEMHRGKKRPENLAVVNSSNVQAVSNKLLHPTTPMLLSVPRTPGDVPQRSRKCSIVQEDEEDEEDISTSGREDLASGHNSLNRRGSRSEGRINVAIQERLAESDRRKADEKPARAKAVCNIKTLESRPRSAHESMTDVMKTNTNSQYAPPTPPCRTTAMCKVVPKHKTMQPPSQSQQSTPPPPPPPPQITLNEIFEESEYTRPVCTQQMVSSSSSGRYTSVHRRPKCNRSRAASCSSSDASDNDDGDNRKKRPHKLHVTTDQVKSAQTRRRDSHDDSSDSQEPSAGATGAGAATSSARTTVFITQSNTNKSNNSKTSTSANERNSSNGRKQTANAVMLDRRHKLSRRRSSETRLRESQSLNRITEEQDGNANVLNATTTPAASAKAKMFRIKFLGFAMGASKRTSCEHLSRPKDPIKSHAEEAEENQVELRDEKVNKLPSTKKMRLLGRYFQMHKRTFLPIPHLFSRNKLYKARSCGSLSEEVVVSSTPLGAEAKSRQRAVTVICNSVGSTSDINQNMGILKIDIVESETDSLANCNMAIVKNVTAGLTNMCAHLGSASKCSFC